MADRSVLVRLRADVSDFERKIAGAAATTSAFANRLQEADGRLAGIVQTGLALAPALVPIGALGIPAIAGLTAQLGFAAAGAGVTLLAFQGVGDALKALNEYQLEPTAANLAKVHETMGTLGPAGQDFVRTLQQIRPEMQQLQDLAQAGLFPGMTEGLDEAMELMPQAERLISTVSSTLGDLFAEAGDNLNDPRWVRFFNFLDAEAGPTLEAMGKSFGNVVEGLAAMVMAFDPLADDFTGGMLDMSRSFNQWAQGLDSSQGFQDFVDYIRETGPEALDTLGAIGNALIELVEAAAPVGQATLPIIEGLADGLAAIADSPVGPVLIGAAAAVGVLGRSMALLKAVGLMGSGGGFIGSVLGVEKMKPGITMIKDTTKATQGLTVAGKAQAAAAISQEKAVRGAALQAGRSAALLAGLAVATTGVADNTGLSNTAMLALMGTIAGPWGAALGTGVGLTLDLANANDTLESAVRRADTAMQSSATAKDQRDAYRDLKAELESTKQSYDDFWTLDPTVNGSPIEGLKSDMKALGTWLSGGTNDAEESLSFLREQMKGTAGAADIMGDAVGMSGRQIRVAAGDVQALSHSLAELQGWLDKRAAIRNYEEAVDGLRAGLRKNAQAWDANTQAGRVNLDLVDQTVTGIMQMAQTMKNADVRAKFLSGARADLVSLAGEFPNARKQINATIERLDRLGLTRPKPKVGLDTSEADGKARHTDSMLEALGRKKSVPKIDADNGPAREKTSTVERWLQELTGKTANPKVLADNSRALSAIGAVQGALSSLHDKNITITTSYIARRISVNAEIATRADGGQMRGPGGPRDDAIPALLSNREWVMPVAAVDHYGAGFMAAIQHRRFADGGSPSEGGGSKARHAAAREFHLSGSMSTRDIRRELHEFEKAMHKAKLGLVDNFDKLGKRAITLSDDWDKAHARVERIRDMRSTVQESFMHDPFEGGLADFDTQVEADTNDARKMRRALRRAGRKGLDGRLAEALSASGNLMLAQEFAGLTRAQIRRRERQFVARSSAGSQLADTAVNVAGLPQAVRAMNHLTRRLNHLEDRIEGAVHKGAKEGTAQRERDRNRDAASRTRTGR